MEISEVILEKAIIKSNSYSTHVELVNVLKKFESKTLEEILGGGEKEEIRIIDNEIHNIVTASIYYNQKSENDSVEEVAQIIFTATKYLRKGISSGDITAILIFLEVNCYLQVEIEKLLPTKELEETYTKPISEKIIEILKGITLTPQSPHDAPYHEKEMLQESIDGFSQNNIAKTYRLIEALEHGGRGFHFNFLLENLISFLYHINFTHFINALLHLQNPADFVFYLQSLKKEDLFKIANEYSLSNKWLNFEIIRQIVEKEDKGNISELEVEAIKTVLNRIKLSDFDFLKQTITYFHNSRLFNASLGAFLTSINNHQIDKIISEVIINEDSFNLNTRDTLREYFIKSAFDEQVDFILTLVFNKWRAYFDNILVTENFYLNRLLLTDFANFVVYYFTYLKDNISLISVMDKLTEKIKFLDSEWTASYSQQLTKFHLYHSELLLLTFAYKNKRLNEPQLSDKYKELINNKIQLSRYVSEETRNFFKQGIQNMEWMRA